MADDKARVKAIGLIGAGEKGSFEFHWIDLLRSVARSSDLPIRPELDRLTGIPIVCVYGEDEAPGVCADPVPGMRMRTHAGGHRVGEDQAGVAGTVLTELGIGS